MDNIYRMDNNTMYIIIFITIIFLMIVFIMYHSSMSQQSQQGQQSVTPPQVIYETSPVIYHTGHHWGPRWGWRGHGWRR